MAQTKSSGAAKKKNSAKAAAPVKKASPARKPVRREVGAVVCLLLGMFTLLGYFIRNAWLVDGLCLYVFKGLFGWGFLAVPPCFFWAAWILFFH